MIFKFLTNKVCVSIPKQIISAKNGLAAIKSPGGKRQNLTTLIKVKKGDWVLTQNNVIIKKISEKQAKEINALLQDYR